MSVSWSSPVLIELIVRMDLCAYFQVSFFFLYIFFSINSVLKRDGIICPEDEFGTRISIDIQVPRMVEFYIHFFHCLLEVCEKDD